jgi:TRAP-type C4-dicarboxylate transport system permease small subunit
MYSLAHVMTAAILLLKRLHRMVVGDSRSFPADFTVIFFYTMAFFASSWGSERRTTKYQHGS